MYLLKNAFRSISRAKGRNLLIALIVLVLSVSSCIGLSIKEANTTLKKQYADDKEISATLTEPRKFGSSNSTTITLDTLKAYAAKYANKSFSYTENIYFSAGTGIEPLDVAGSFSKNQDFKNKYGDIQNGQSSTTSSTTSSDESTSVSSSSISLYPTLSTGTASASLITLSNTSDASSDSESGNSSSTEVDSDKNTSTNSNSGTESNNQDGNENNTTMPEENNNKGTTGNTGSNSADTTRPTPPSESNQQNGGKGGNTFITNQFFFNMGSMNDFTLIGGNSDKGMPEYVKSLNVIDYSSSELNCVISKNLADSNSLKVGSTFTLVNPNNENESYTFTVSGICDTSTSTEETNTSSNASYIDNNIYVSSAAVDSIIAASEKTNPSTASTTSSTSSTTDTTTTTESKALTAIYSGTYTFSNLTDYNTMSDAVQNDSYTLVSEDVENYEQSVQQLDTLGGYATYFLLVIFIIGAIVLVIINLFSIRDRKYEIGVLTAIGMKKLKVAGQFVIELFAVTFAALIIGSAAGAVLSVPITNKLLTTINQPAETEQTASNSNTEITSSNTASTSSATAEQPSQQTDNNAPGQNGEFNRSNKMNFGQSANNYIASVTSATDLSVIGQMILVGLGLTLISALSAVLFVMRYEPLKILSNRD